MEMERAKQYMFDSCLAYSNHLRELKEQGKEGTEQYVVAQALFNQKLVDVNVLYDWNEYLEWSKQKEGR